MKALWVVVVLHLCARCIAESEGNDKVATLSQEISGMALNATANYLHRYLAACANTSTSSLQPLMAAFQEGTTRILLQQAALDAPKLEVRIQLDTLPNSPRIMESVRSFNADQSSVDITLLPTPAYSSPREISFDRPTLAADGRWSDFAGGTMDDISIYLDPKIQRVQHLMHFRKDIFQRHNVSRLPETWDQVLELARQLNGTDFDGDGVPDYALCFNMQQSCRAPYMLMEAVLPMMYYAASTVKAFHLNPDTLEPEFQNAAMHAALHMLTKLSAFNNPASSASCYPYDLRFCAGQCAMTFNMGMFSLPTPTSPNTSWTACGALGHLGAALSPGSSVVLDRASNTLVPCTRLLCPYAIPSARDSSVLVNFVPMTSPVILSYLPNPSLVSDTSAALGAFASHDTTRTQLYSQAYLAAMQLQPASSSAPIPGVSDADIAAAVAAAARSTAIARPSFTIDPRPYLRLGYDLHDAACVLSICAEVLAFKNRYKGSPVPGAAYFRISLGEAAVNASAPGANITDVIVTLESKYRMVVLAFNNTSLYRKLYWSGIDYKPAARAAGGRGITGFLKREQAAAVLVAAGVLALIILGLAYARRQHRIGRSLLGKQLAPGVGPCTTLLVTDIQGSTGLWETLSAEVMEQVLGVHHSTLQQLLEAHRGYESATEGDSFILAFHSPSDALAYAVAAQKALLEAAWPQELLDHSHLSTASTARALDRNAVARLSHVIQGLQAAGAMRRSISLSQWTASTNFRAPTTDQPATSAPEDATPAFTPPATPIASPVRRLASKFALRWGFPRGSSTSAARGAAATGADDRRDDGRDSMLLDTGDTVHIDQGPQTCSFARALSQAWEEASQKFGHSSSPSPTSSAAPLIWRGLRVRMGLHSGLSDPTQVVINPTTRRTQYSGSFAATAKHVCDSGHGGQILLSHCAFEQIGKQQAASFVDIFAMGAHVFEGDQLPVSLYQAIIPGLAARLQSFPPLRSQHLVAEGVLAATVGVATIVFVNASGVQTLMGWDVEVTRQALQMYHDKVQSTLQKYGGYVAELADGLALVVFPRPEQAIRWALEVQTRLMAARWPQKLLEHELCEPVVTTVAIESEDGNVAEVQKMAMRGLRLKVGISTGAVMDYINTATARIMYRGRVMNWAARISHLATGGQVLCCTHSWDVASDAYSKLEGIAAVNAGLHKMKGIQNSVHLYSCTYMHSCATGVSTTTGHPERRMTTQLMIGTDCEQLRACPSPVTPRSSSQADLVSDL